MPEGRNGPWLSIQPCATGCSPPAPTRFQQLANADHLGAGLLVTLADVEAVLAALDRDA
jgi:hypothetical protein